MAKLDDLLKKLQSLPYGTKEHSDVLRKIQKNHLSKYKDQFILCTDGWFTKKGRDASRMSTNDPTFLSSFYFNNRQECEYNMDHRQVIVNAVVTTPDRDKFIVLQESNGKISLIGGHVDYDPEDYQLAITDTLRRNMLKELNEEVKNANIIASNLPSRPIDMIHQIHEYGDDKPTIYDYTHMFYVYLVELSPSEFNDQVKKMKQNEDPYKPIVIGVKELMNSKSKGYVKNIISSFT